MKPLERKVLQRVHALLTQGWTQRVIARTKTGTHCSFSSPDACCWCLTGAVYLACEEAGGDDTLAADIFGLLGFEAEPNSRHYYAAHWNDWPDPLRTKEEVLQRVAHALVPANEQER